MNSVFSQVLMAIFRYLLAGVATYLVGHEIVDKDLADRFIGETASWLLGLVLSGGLVWWAVIRKQAEAYFKRNMAIAGASQDVTTPEQVVAGAAKLQAEGNKPGPIKGHSTEGTVTKSVVAILLSIGLVANISCARPNPSDAPDEIAKKTASYATDGVRYVRVAQDAISAYAVAQGGRTEVTDVPSRTIRDFAIPAAEHLSKVLRGYSAASTPDLKKASAVEIMQALDEYEKIVGDAIGSRANLPAGLTTALAQTVVDIRELITNVRKLFGSTQPVTI